MSVFDLAIKVEQVIIIALDGCSIKVEPHIGLSGKRVEYESYMDALSLVRTVLQASQCVATGASQRPYVFLLQEWSAWQRRSQADLEEVGLPVLEQIVQGARAVQHLRMWYEKQSEKDESTIKELADVILSPSLADGFGALTKCIVDDALDAFAKKSPASLLSMQDGNMVKRCESEGRLSNVVHLLLGARRSATCCGRPRAL